MVFKSVTHKILRLSFYIMGDFMGLINLWNIAQVAVEITASEWDAIKCEKNIMLLAEMNKL